MPLLLNVPPAILTVAVALTAAAPEELFAVASDGVELAGHLYRPATDVPVPAVILTHGSERGTRTHPGYVRWAEGLRARGVAALVFDKRGAGASGGEYVEAPDLAVPAGDVLAWMDVLRARADLRPDAIGVLGWSQGGWVGPLAATRGENVAFVVSISGPCVSPLEQNVYDKTNRFRTTGATPEQVASFENAIRRVWTYFGTGTGRAEARAAWDAVADEPWFLASYEGPPMMDRAVVLGDPRMAHYVAHQTYDPAPVLARLNVPSLFVFGGDDPVVPVPDSLAALERAFGDAAAKGRPRPTVKVYAGADHGIRVETPEGDPAFPEGYPDFVLDWVAAASGGPQARR